MRQDQLEGLVAFVCVAENSSFSAAAIQLGVSPSAVSQSIRNLEARLGIPLFNRTTRSVRLTEAGAQYLDRIGPTLRELLVASEDVGLAESEASGLLRLNVPRAGFMILLQPVLRRFLDHYPKIKVEIALNNQLVDSFYMYVLENDDTEEISVEYSPVQLNIKWSEEWTEINEIAPCEAGWAAQSKNPKAEMRTLLSRRP